MSSLPGNAVSDQDGRCGGAAPGFAGCLASGAERGCRRPGCILGSLLFCIKDKNSVFRIIGHNNALDDHAAPICRSEEHTSELQSLMHISYAVFCLKQKTHSKII